MNLILAIPYLEYVQNLLNMCKVVRSPQTNFMFGKMTSEIIWTFLEKIGIFLLMSYGNHVALVAKWLGMRI